MPLLASAHLILMSYDSTCKYRPPTSIHGLLMGHNCCLGHVISRTVFMTIMINKLSNAHMDSFQEVVLPDGCLGNVGCYPDKIKITNRVSFIEID